MIVNCTPSTDYKPEPTQSDPPALSDFYRIENKIILLFDVPLFRLDPAKITITKFDTVLDPTEYKLDVDNKKLVVDLLSGLSRNQKYSVDILSGAVSNSVGKTNATRKIKNFIIDTPPILDVDIPPFFDKKSNNKFILVFNKNVSILDDKKITIEKKINAESDFETVTPLKILVNTSEKREIEITVPTPRIDEEYKVILTSEALKADSESNEKITSQNIRIVDGPSLAPKIRHYRVDDSLVIPFDSFLSEDVSTKIFVYRDEQKLSLTTEYIITTLKMNLIIRLVNPAQIGEKYRVELQIGAVKDSNNKKNAIPETNLLFPVATAPALDEGMPPYIAGAMNNLLTVTFDKAISLLDKNQIQVKKKSHSEAKFETVNLLDMRIASDSRKLEISLPETKLAEQYRIILAKAAVRNGAQGNSLISPEDKDITITHGPSLTNITPKIDGPRLLTITFPVDIQLLDTDRIQVSRKPADSEVFVLLAPEKWVLESDNTDKRKVRINFVDDITLYVPWKIYFSKGTIIGIADRNNNRNELTTNNLEPDYGDIYTWEKAETKNTDKSGAIWAKRTRFSSVVFDNKIWVLGGYDRTNYYNDVWNSADGINWTEITKGITSTRWGERYGHATVVLNNEVWVLGGNEKTSQKNDVWKSKDGKNWIEVLSADTRTTSRWRPITPVPGVVFDNKIWILGSINSSEIWSSTNGRDWTKNTENAIWPVRLYHSSIAFDGKIWVIGGLLTGKTKQITDLWVSSNSIDWTESATFDLNELRFSSQAVKYKDRLWLLGGEVANTHKNDTWSRAKDTDSVWIEEVPNSEWASRYGHSALVFKDKIWVLGGESYVTRTGRRLHTQYSDVWSFGLPQSISR